MKEHIVQKAKDIIADYNKKIKDFETVCHAGICPICGIDLTLNREEVEYIETVGIFKKEKIRKSVRVTIVCPEGHKLIHPKGHDVSGPGYCVWDGCLNKEIGDYHNDHYDIDDDDFN